jgi:gamma-butyrobetaine dioxygenase
VTSRSIRQIELPFGHQVAAFHTSARVAQAPAQKAVSGQPPFASRIPIEVDGQTRTFDSIWLRDACKCPLCVDPSTSQKNFQTADIPADIEGSAQITSELEEADLALITWKTDIAGLPEGHQTAIPLSFLRQALDYENQVKARQYAPSGRVLWNNDRMSRDNKFIDYNSYMKNDKTLYTALSALHTHGLVFIHNVPDTISTDSAISVANIVERIGSIRHTFYGRTWDVRSVPNAINVAYTHVFLGLHMDLCYMDNTPHLQFLHSMRARAPGGESMFADSFYAAELIRRDDPELWDALRTFPVTYNYFNAGQSYRQVRPTVVLEDQDDPASPIRWLNWSPPFQGPFSNDIGTADGGKALRTYHAAVQKFNAIVNAPENVFELRMDEGTCVIFDNRRTLHARRAFDSLKGERWLKGCYMDRDAYASKLAVLGQVYGQK